MKLKLNLPLTPKSTQRCTQAGSPETQVAAVVTIRKNSPFDLLTNRANKPVRIPAPIILARPVFRGNKSYLRALRAAEMAVWNASIKFPMFAALLLATFAI